MEANQVQEIVTALGGPAQVARLCGINSTQAVSMWISRKEIPQARLMYLMLIRPDVFKAEKAEKVGAGDTAKVI